MICLSCSKEVRPGSLYCHHCGAKLPKTEVIPKKTEDQNILEEPLSSKETRESSKPITGMEGLCDICNIRVDKYNSHLLSATDFHFIVRNGFNPYEEDIRFQTGLRLSELASAVGMSPQEAYKGWKKRALDDNSSWNLCNRCYLIAVKYCDH